MSKYRFFILSNGIKQTFYFSNKETAQEYWKAYSRDCLVSSINEVQS